MRKSIKSFVKRYDKKIKFSKTIKILIDFVGIILLWRSTWGLVDMFVFPDQPLLSHLVTAAVGLILLTIDGDGLSDLNR